ncbi:replication protein a 70 kda dna-binding subunit c [Nicotiana attenuata]|uniref:Replication protein a 70 kDa dna-binding subunit c n=1 Tax=Nicotiana attenuata TaxID=49451 RepID=A0A314KRY7_NICAT|nr:replication protein a 70 kda dna-binding subunit c [Nicotiana attenuata]
MPPINLTEGAIAILTNREAHAEDFKPVLQITDIRLVNTQNQNNNNERYRILLSDGEFLQQGMLATQKNDLIRSQQIQKGSIIQMNQFVCNNIQNRMIIIVIELDILLETCDTIGEPKHYLPNGISPSVPRPAAPLQPSTNQSGGLSGSPQSFTAVSATSSSAPRSNMPGGMQSPESTRSIGYNTSSAESMNPVANYGGSNSSISRESGLQGNQQGQYGNQFTGSQFAPPGSTGMCMSCNSCGGTGHSASNCPSIMSGQVQAYGGGFGNKVTSGMSSDGASGECYKCHQFGHWARDCPGVSNAPPANNMTPASGMSSGGASGECYKCHQLGHWARDCPGVSSAPAANNMTPGRYGNPPRQRVGGF